MRDPDLQRPPHEQWLLTDAVAPGWRLEYVAAAGSTNVLATARVAAGADPGLVVVTDHQTAGRGRLDRDWVTPAGMALTCSAVVDPGVPDARWPWLPLLAGLAVADAVRRATPAATALKWPNDVLVGERKLAGILVERIAPTGRRPLAVVGVGLNVHQRVLPVDTATSLALEGATLDRAVLLAEVLTRLADLLAGWRDADGDPSALRSAYTAQCATLGQQVTVRLAGGGTLRGRAESVDAFGRLVVSSEGGDRAVGAGDVIHVRRTGQSPTLDLP